MVVRIYSHSSYIPCVQMRTNAYKCAIVRPIVPPAWTPRATVAPGPLRLPYYSSHPGLSNPAATDHWRVPSSKSSYTESFSPRSPSAST